MILAVGSLFVQDTPGLNWMSKAGWLAAEPQEGHKQTLSNRLLRDLAPSQGL